ncbi:MAG: MBL fold metallo-hydrolase [Gaiellales bacterium]
MSRAVALSDSVSWWPSTLFQTTTLEVRRAGQRLLVDPGVSPWEIAEVTGADVTQVVITHADWDHVLGIGHLPDASVTASRAAAERIASPEAREQIARPASEYYLALEHLDRLRVDNPVDPPAELQLGPWSAVCRAAPGHTEDGMIVLLPDEGLLIAGDYLSQLEIPFVFHSAWDYSHTLHTLIGVIEREHPEFVVVGHGRPLPAERALQIADEDLDYVDALIAFAEAGRPSEHAGEIAIPDRGGFGDASQHVSNVRRACAAVPVA